MTDEEFVRQIGRLHNLILSIRKDENYEINQSQMDKLVNLYKFFVSAQFGPEDNVRIENLVPAEEHGGVIATFLVFNVCGEDRIKEFCDALSGCSAFGIDSLEDGTISIECTVPYVFKKKLN